jgi:LysM repeat protein
MYSPCDNLSFNKKQVNTMINTKQINDIKKIREKINLNDIENKSLIDVDVFPNLSTEGRMSNPNMFDGELECNFTFIDPNMGVEQKRAKIPFEYTLSEMPENCNSNFDMQISNEDFVIQDGGDINCNIDMEILGTLSENRSLNLIDEVEKEEASSDQDYSVVVYIVKKGDTLWNIAKKFRTTVDFIARTNGIEDENQIQIGQKLYIPRYSK